MTRSRGRKEAGRRQEGREEQEGRSGEEGDEKENEKKKKKKKEKKKKKNHKISMKRLNHHPFHLLPASCLPACLPPASCLLPPASCLLSPILSSFLFRSLCFISFSSFLFFSSSVLCGVEWETSSASQTAPAPALPPRPSLPTG